MKNGGGGDGKIPEEADNKKIIKIDGSKLFNKLKTSSQNQTSPDEPKLNHDLLNTSADANTVANTNQQETKQTETPIDNHSEIKKEDW